MRLCKSFTFDAAHSLPGHPGKCRNLHGHTYRLDVEMRGPIRASGMVMDFSDLAMSVQERVLRHLDHHHLNEIIPNPTAENLILWISEALKDLKDQWVTQDERRHLLGITRLRLYEGPDSWVEIP